MEFRQSNLKTEFSRIHVDPNKKYTGNLPTELFRMGFAQL